jgi:hypothetical protein
LGELIKPRRESVASATGGIPAFKITEPEGCPLTRLPGAAACLGWILAAIVGSGSLESYAITERNRLDN